MQTPLRVYIWNKLSEMSLFPPTLFHFCYPPFVMPPGYFAVSPKSP